MGLLNIFLNALTKIVLNRSQEISKFIFYKIVHFNEKSNQYLFQCINTKATFLATITDLILDGDILYSLHPIQACYIGIEYAAQIKNNQQSIVFSVLPAFLWVHY